SSFPRYADQLYEDLMYMYNKQVRPVKNASKALMVNFGASLIRIIDVDEVNQVLTTNLWLEMQWYVYDYKLSWDPKKYKNLSKIHIPSDQLWIPDILLYNNADGEPHISINSDAIVCQMKFGGWTYSGLLINVRPIVPKPGDKIEIRTDQYGNNYQYLKQGMDLSSYVRSLEWDLMELEAARHEQIYSGCCGQDMYIDITYNIRLRRKTLFYTVNLVIPCMLIAILTTFVFYIPPNEHKCSYSISVLVALTVFYLVLIELIPPTSTVIPLIGKYLLFTMFLVATSIFLSVASINFYRRDGTTHAMPKWMHKLFIQILPTYLCIKKPDDFDDENSLDSDDDSNTTDNPNTYPNSRRPSPYFLAFTNNQGNNNCMLEGSELGDGEMRLSQLAQLRGMHSDLIRRMISNLAFISDHFKAKAKQSKISEEWSYVAIAIDRLLLIFYSIINITGSLLILTQAPALFDTTQPLDIQPPTQPLSGDTFGEGKNATAILLDLMNLD
uniref:Neurotransmitter-gated ion-channel ligand-binding domain-containing protein n=1 Tax=Strongyloides stercoralis TaxID=6248 RepID=A0AAF5D1G1_STRER